LVWNPGERVERYTNLLQTLIMSVFTALLDKSTAVLAVQVLGVLLVLGCVYLVRRLCTYLMAEIEPGGRTLFTAAVVLMTLTYYPLSYWSLSGMETGILTLLILAAVCMIERYRQDGRSLDLYLIAGLLGLAYLCRPDSIIFAIPLLAYAADITWRRRGNGQGYDGSGGVLRTLLLALLIYVVFPLGQEAFRIQYYHALLPNTYYLKLGGIPLIDRIRNGLGFLSLYFWTHAVFLGMGCLGFALRPDRRKGCYLLLVVAPILYEIWAGGAPLRLWRLMAPVEPLAASLFVMGRWSSCGGWAPLSQRTKVPRGWEC
jgi:arabinofuranosyltransferase